MLLIIILSFFAFNLSSKISHLNLFLQPEEIEDPEKYTPEEKSLSLESAPIPTRSPESTTSSPQPQSSMMPSQPSSPLPLSPLPSPAQSPLPSSPDQQLEWETEDENEQQVPTFSRVKYLIFEILLIYCYYQLFLYVFHAIVKGYVSFL